MNLTQSLLYLLLLYAVLDKNNKLSITTGLLIAFGILLLNCYCSRSCNRGNNAVSSEGNPFLSLNGF